MQYPMRLVVDVNRIWHASFRDVPAIQVKGITPEIAKSEAQNLLFKTILSLLNTGDRIPRPSSGRVGDHMISLPDNLARRIGRANNYLRSSTSLSQIRSLLKGW